MTASPSAFQPVSEQDRELLSAYIDQQLAVEERQALERRLEQEPALRRELEELQTTVALLRDLPALELPRAFTLDPATAPKRRSFWQQLLPFGGGLVGVALIMLIGITFFGASGASVALAPPSPDAAEMAEEGFNAQETAPLVEATEWSFGEEATAEAETSGATPPEDEAMAEAAPAGELPAEEEAAAGEMAAEEAADAVEPTTGGQAAPEAALPSATSIASDEEVAAADVPPAARLGETDGGTSGAEPPALQASPPLLATSQSTSPDTLDLPAEESPAAPAPGAAPQSPLLPALLAAGIAAGILLGLWLARQRRSR